MRLRPGLRIDSLRSLRSPLAAPTTRRATTRVVGLEQRLKTHEGGKAEPAADQSTINIDNDTYICCVLMLLLEVLFV